ncbi:TetR/AcrR family transcriptional regulator [Gordonia sp. TBRC 11910]|uniref:TetR/AcrR family transcriptional regulator n=1 Tax=Gordonia asplenii TaxID=2725283 RepID=A0A848L148_9ACTN|nr:TetR/AcrR family transcriptional regulator [Gordonia asplenii]NMO04187.1 TetR/AcrR family transcriptional regulator [Gordonia asplenii]
MTTPRARKRLAIEAQILTLGREQLATVGAAALSLRAIARELNMVSSAVYRYVESRDELLTRLVVEAFGELADAVNAALCDAADGTHRRRLEVLAHAFRAWSVVHPSQYALLYGSPVPGYDAPPERTGEPGTRVMIALITILADANAAGAFTADDDVDADLTDDFGRIRNELDLDLSDSQFAYALCVWTWLVGAVGQEVFGGFGADTFGAPRLVFDAQLASILGTHLR